VAEKLNRTTFVTSREMDFFSAKELVTQTGHEMGDWPLVIVKELFDNALDACEDADIPPVICVTADAAGITIRDNGPGLPEKTLAGALDFTVRASSREAYVSPSRGAQGNALKTLIALPSVLDAACGKFIVEAHGKRHVITCGADPISQRAVIHHDETTLPKSKKTSSSPRTKKQAVSRGTAVRIEWAPRGDGDRIFWPFGGWCLPLDATGSCGVPCCVQEILQAFALFNPHLTITLNWFGQEATWTATNPRWHKWKPCHPTSAHWYEPHHLARLIGAYISCDRESGTDRLVSDFIAEFDGLSGSVKRSKVLDRAGLKRVKLSELVVGGHLDAGRIAKLSSAMQADTRPVKSPRLGIIGEDHFRKRFLTLGVTPDSFRYCRRLAKSKNSQSAPNQEAGSLPWVLEAAFGWLGPKAADERRIYTGTNWSAAINNPFRSFGDTGEGLETTLAEMRATRSEPIVYAIHLAHPRIEYTDRAKSALVIGGAA
jgi:hypothetical protein